jgi:hypothetical protein
MKNLVRIILFVNGNGLALKFIYLYCNKTKLYSN